MSDRISREAIEIVAGPGLNRIYAWLLAGVLIKAAKARAGYG